MLKKLGKKKRFVLIVLIAVVLLLSGLLVGSYYATEIHVVLRHLWTDITSPQTSPSLSTPLPPEKTVVSTSTVKLHTVPEPIPLIYSDTLEETQIQDYLKEGAVVLPLGTSFGQPGNVVVTAHSSGTQAFGPYRFAFSKLSELNEGDEFSVTTPTATYTYKVYKKEIVWPHEVDKLPQDNRSTVTLVTCWPLWTNFKRLLVHSELVGTEGI